MKKTILLFLALVFMSGLVGCEKKPHSKWSEESIEACYDAISIIQEVIDSTMNAETAYRKLQDIEESLKTDDALSDKFIMGIMISSAQTTILSYKIGVSSTTKHDLEKQIEKLENALYNGT